MNYYIQGSADRAKQIKAAFEKLGCDTTGWKFNVEGELYYTHEGRIYLACSNFLINLIKTHPGYQELELLVEPKFKVGQIICPTAESGLRPVNVEIVGVDVDKQCYTIKQKGYAASPLPFKFQDRYVLMYHQSKPHYDIANFQPFDKVLVRQNDSSTWGVSFFGRCSGGMFMCCTNVWFEQCIPFNDKTKHLLGTTDMPSEEYINW